MFIHLWLAHTGLLFSQFVIQPSCIHPLSTPPFPSLSLTCPGYVKGKVFVWEMAVWRVKRMRHTDTYTNTCRRTRIHSQVNTGSSSVRQPCDGQHWHLAGGMIRWWRGVGERKQVARGWRGLRGRREGTWKISGTRVVVSFCGYLPLHCSLAENEAMC